MHGKDPRKLVANVSFSTKTASYRYSPFAADNPGGALDGRDRLGLLLAAKRRVGFYLLNDQLLHPANGTDTSYVGSQPRAELTWQIDRHLSLDGAYEYFWSGPFLHQSPPDRDINYCYVRMTYKF